MGSIGIATSKRVGSSKGTAPNWQCGRELSVRKTGEKEISEGTQKLGIEVFGDENNGSLVYVCEKDSIAIVPGKQAKVREGKAKDPDLLHPMEMAVRRAGGKDFTRETKTVSVEVYRDANNGNVIHISEAGGLAVVAE